MPKRDCSPKNDISSEEVSVGLLVDIIYVSAGRRSTEAQREMFFYCAIEMSCSPSEEAMEKEEVGNNQLHLLHYIYLSNFLDNLYF